MFLLQKLRILLFAAILFSSALAIAQENINVVLVPENSLSPVEQHLYTIINEYRATKGLAAVSLSPSLNLVARTHAIDLAENCPDKGSCNLHSWSNKGNWAACCYTSDHSKAACMWNKPRELTSYQGDGFEIAFWTDARYANDEEYAVAILDGWKQSNGHNEVIINRGIWKNNDWKAIGIGVYNGYAVVWFGREEDPAGIQTRE